MTHSQEPTEQEEIMSAQEAAAALGVSRSTLTELIREGYLQPVGGINPLLGRQHTYRFNAADIARLLANPPQRRRKPRKS
jgi:excisionase family DNA binding protein